MSSLFGALTTEENWMLCRYLCYQRKGRHLLQMSEKSGDKLSGVAGDAGAGAFWTKSRMEKVNLHSFFLAPIPDHNFPFVCFFLSNLSLPSQYN